jgi:hypothetical protein
VRAALPARPAATSSAAPRRRLESEFDPIAVGIRAAPVESVAQLSRWSAVLAACATFSWFADPSNARRSLSPSRAAFLRSFLTPRSRREVNRGDLFRQCLRDRVHPQVARAPLRREPGTVWKSPTCDAYRGRETLELPSGTAATDGMVAMTSACQKLTATSFPVDVDPCRIRR